MEKHVSIELKEKVLSLPFSPGVYLMKDKSGTIIYVGKAKKLKNRVSQYFQDSTAHTAKTLLMVSHIADFDYIVAASEFEALILECSLIKRHQPKYNILLKDDKGYPFIRVNLKERYPRFSIVGKRLNDEASYFGPYGGRAVTQQAIHTICQILKLPTCSKSFPRDIGKERPCLNYQIGNCDGWCQSGRTQAEYVERIRQAVMLLEGKNKELKDNLVQQMEEAANRLEFEAAAQIRDRLKAIKSLSNKQLVCSGASADTDVIGLWQGLAKTGFAVLHFVDGNLIDKDIQILESKIDETMEEVVSSLLKQYYIQRGIAPYNIYLPCEIEDSPLFERYLRQEFKKKIHISRPVRGDHVRLVELACTNAREEAERLTNDSERANKTLQLMANILNLGTIRRIEAYDISNLGNTDIVASMTVFIDGRPAKKEYKRFKLKNLNVQDDYASMEQVLKRRFQHYLEGDQGFSERPDLLLIDGGEVHADTVRRQLNSIGISIPILGMVKDDRHRTRALVTPDGEEIGIQTNQAIFSLIGKIQEETHRFAITYQRELRSKRLSYSALDNIAGVGDKRKQLLIREFKSLKGIRMADIEQLKRVVPESVAKEIYKYFHNAQ